VLVRKQFRRAAAEPKWHSGWKLHPHPERELGRDESIDASHVERPMRRCQTLLN
jgi:hypothetical protein